MRCMRVCVSNALLHLNILAKMNGNRLDVVARFGLAHLRSQWSWRLFYKLFNTIRIELNAHSTCAIYSLSLLYFDVILLVFLSRSFFALPPLCSLFESFLFVCVCESHTYESMNVSYANCSFDWTCDFQSKTAHKKRNFIRTLKTEVLLWASGTHQTKDCSGNLENSQIE